MMAAMPDRVRTSVIQRLARNWRIDALPARLASPLVSFSFDDFPRTALTNGGRILSEHGCLGTFYVSGVFEGRTENGIVYFDRDDLRRVASEGHEIGCHTFGHLRLPGKGRAEIEQSLAQNAGYVREVLAEDYMMSTFAYPFGAISMSSKRLLHNVFSVCRSTEPHVNAGTVDFAQLGAVGLDMRSFDVVKIERIIDEAVARKGWLNFFTHDVSDNPSPFGCTPPAFRRVVEMVVDRGIDILPVKNATGRVRFG